MEVSVVVITVLSFGSIGFMWGALIELHRRSGSIDVKSREFPFTVLRSSEFMSINQKVLFFVLVIGGFFGLIAIISFPLVITVSNAPESTVYVFLSALPLMIMGKALHGVIRNTRREKK